ncbi:MAG TPA: glycosyl hydrolase family 79 C-terminal domain-containing protein [Bryobacteraceae bacterium]
MNRRAFLAGFGAAALGLAARARPIRVAVDTRRRLAAIPSDFLGLGYEISSVAIPGLLSARDRTYVQLVRTLSPRGVIRIGGNTSDYASFKRDAKAVSAPKGTVINNVSLRQLGTFLEATNWRLIWGLNLGSGNERQAVAEAEAVTEAVDSKLLAFQIGNEPDLFGGRHRPSGYSYEDYLKEFRRYRDGIRAKLPQTPFAGPDVAGATDWVTRFAVEEARDLKLLTHHYYRQCAGPSSTLSKLLHPDPKLGPELAKLRAASKKADIPYRICEANSFCGGGQPGVSDTFGAALWGLDFLFTLAYAGCSGVNLETGVNQLGFVSSYSPIRRGEQGGYIATPLYYGMLAFGRASRGRCVAVDCDASGANVTAYAVAGDRAGLSVTIINKDASLDADVSLSLPKTMGDGRILRLKAPSLQSKEGVRFGGSAVTTDGRWRAAGETEVFRSRGGRGAVHVPRGSAVVLKWE